MQKQVKQTLVEGFPKNQSFSDKRTQSQSPSRSRRTYRTSSFPDAIEKEPDTATPLSGQSPLRSRRTFKTSSFPHATEKEPDTTTLSSTDQFLFQTLRSFYRKECEEDMTKIGRDVSNQSRFIGTPSRSSRVFISEEASDSWTEEQDDSITILTYSKSPYVDFRQSMQEMVEARVASNGVVDRQFMEELLFRYLDLNSEKFYGYIVRAFLDLIVISREDSGGVPARRRPWMGGRRRLKLEIKRMRKFCENQFVPK